MIERGGGSIVYTGSAAGNAGSPAQVGYAMSTAPGQALMRHVAARYGAQGVRANTIAPALTLHPRVEGVIPVEMIEGARHAARVETRVGRPDDRRLPVPWRRVRHTRLTFSWHHDRMGRRRGAEKFLERRTALVTGASRGLGRGIAEAYAECGALVAIDDASNDAAAAETRAAIDTDGRHACAARRQERETWLSA